MGSMVQRAAVLSQTHNGRKLVLDQWQNQSGNSDNLGHRQNFSILPSMGLQYNDR